MQKLIILIIFIFSLTACQNKDTLIDSSDTASDTYAYSQEFLLNNSEWVPITEEDRITLAFTAHTDNISKLTTSLKSGIPSIVYVVGGLFDNEEQGNYLVLQSFDTSGNVIVLDPINGYKKVSYPIEVVLENAYKVLLFKLSEV